MLTPRHSIRPSSQGVFSLFLGGLVVLIGLIATSGRVFGGCHLKPYHATTHFGMTDSRVASPHAFLTVDQDSNAQIRNSIDQGLLPQREPCRGPGCRNGTDPSVIPSVIMTVPIRIQLLPWRALSSPNTELSSSRFEVGISARPAAGFPLEIEHPPRFL